MPQVNVYRNIDTESQFVETITVQERDARTALMVNVDPAGLAAPYGYRDEDGVVWGFALAATAAEIAALLPQRHLTPEQDAAELADLQRLLGGA